MLFYFKVFSYHEFEQKANVKEKEQNALIERANF